MNKKFFISVLFLSVVLGTSSLPAAETPLPSARDTIRGTVDSLDAVGNTLNLVRTDQFKGEEINLLVSQDAVYSGAGSLGELQRGQQITVEVEKNAMGKLEVKRIDTAPPLAAAAS